MATKKTSASKASRKAASKKPKAKLASKKGTTKKQAPAKTTGKKTSAKKIAAKKTAAKKSVLKKAAVKKTAAQKTVIKKTATKKSPAKKAALKKASSGKKPAQGATRKAVAKKAVTHKAVTKKAVGKSAVKTLAPSKVAPKKAAATKPIAKPSAAVARKAAAIKRVRTAAKVPMRKNAIKPNQPPATPVRRTASAVLRAKTANGGMTKLAGAVRVPVLPSSVSRRAARSAARGLAPAPVAASTQDTKARMLSDEPLSEQKLREHIRTAVLYLEAWLRSSGADISPAVAELAAPAEAARAQVWRWLDREARFDDGQIMTAALLEETLHQEMQLLRDDMGPEVYDAGLFATAAPLFLDSALAPDFADFPMSAAKLLD